MKNSKAFTLVELMIVIAIIGILAASLFPMLQGYIQRAKNTSKINNIRNIATAIEARFIDKGNYELRPSYNYGNYLTTGIGSDGVISNGVAMIYVLRPTAADPIKFATPVNYSPTITGGQTPIDTLIDEKYISEKSGIPYRYVSNTVRSYFLYSIAGVLIPGDITESATNYTNLINSRSYNGVTPTILLQDDLYIYYYNSENDTFGIYGTLNNIGKSSVENIYTLNQHLINTSLIPQDRGNMFEYFGLNYGIGKNSN